MSIDYITITPLFLDQYYCELDMSSNSRRVWVDDRLILKMSEIIPYILKYDRDIRVKLSDARYLHYERDNFLKLLGITDLEVIK